MPRKHTRGLRLDGGECVEWRVESVEWLDEMFFRLTDWLTHAQVYIYTPIYVYPFGRGCVLNGCHCRRWQVYVRVCYGPKDPLIKSVQHKLQLTAMSLTYRILQYVYRKWKSAREGRCYRLKSEYFMQHLTTKQTSFKRLKNKETPYSLHPCWDANIISPMFRFIKKKKKKKEKERGAVRLTIKCFGYRLNCTLTCLTARL